MQGGFFKPGALTAPTFANAPKPSTTPTPNALGGVTPLMQTSTPSTTTQQLNNPSFAKNLGFGTEVTGQPQTAAPSVPGLVPLPGIQTSGSNFTPTSTGTQQGPLFNVAGSQNSGGAPAAPQSQVNPNAGYNAGVPQQQAPVGTPVAQPASQGQQPINQQGLLKNLLDQQNTYRSQLQNLASQSQAVGTQFGQMEGNILGTPGEMGYQTGRINQLEQLKQGTQANIAEQESALQSAEAPLLSNLTSAAGQLGPQQQTITPPAGGTTFDALTGQSYTNPELGPIGSQQFYNPNQPNGGGTPFTAGEVSGNTALGQQYAQNVSANNQAESIRGQIDQTLAGNPQLNPSSFTDVNKALQFLNGKVSNPAYQTLSNQLTEYVNTLAPILGVGGDTTNLKTQIAQGFVNAAASGQSLSSVLQSISQLAQTKLNAQKGGESGSVQQPNNTNANSTTASAWH